MVDFAKSLFNFSGFNGRPGEANQNPNVNGKQDAAFGITSPGTSTGRASTATSNTVASGSIFTPSQGNNSFWGQQQQQHHQLQQQQHQHGGNTNSATSTMDSQTASDLSGTGVLGGGHGSNSSGATAMGVQYQGDSTTSQNVGDSGNGGGDSVFKVIEDVNTIGEAVAANPESLSTLPPKGKLKVRISEARNLNIKTANCYPYIVCSYDTSEYITQGPTGSVPNSNYLNDLPTGGIAIPSKSRQSSNLTLHRLAKNAEQPNQQSQQNQQNQQHQQHQQQAQQQVQQQQQQQQQQQNTQVSKDTNTAGFNNTPANPMWQDEAQFDVTSDRSLLFLTIYDANNQDAFLGSAKFQPNLTDRRVFDTWIPLQGRASGEAVSGEIRVSLVYEKVSKKHYGPEDFEILRLIGKGTFGRVFQVRKKDTQRIYAMKVLSKKAIVQKREIAHTIGERNILVRTSGAQSAFIVGLKFSFQTPTDLYLVTDFMSGGELFWHLQKEGKFDEKRAKFYIAELIIALEHLHDNGIVYRDLKPENILLDANGHVVLCDFGLSKANLDDGTTNTFCGTTEYLAPEVLLDDQGYTKMVDFWSLGVLVFEMCCGWSPFYAEDNQQMYKNIAFGKVRFPKDALSSEGRNFVKGLLNRNPRHRLGAINDARELKEHPFFSDVDWDLLVNKKIPPPFKPHITSETDTSNFDPEFTSTSVMNRSIIPMSSTPLSPGIQANFQGFTYVDDTLEDHFRNSAAAKTGISYRPRSNMPRKHDDDIELYDEKDIEISQSYYNESSMGQKKINNGLDKMDEDVEIEDDDMRMDDDEEDDDHDFVNGQGFEM